MSTLLWIVVFVLVLVVPASLAFGARSDRLTLDQLRGTFGMNTLIEENGRAVVMIESGPDALRAVQALRDITGLGLANAKLFVANTPLVVARGLANAEAQLIAERLRQSGATVEIR